MRDQYQQGGQRTGQSTRGENRGQGRQMHGQGGTQGDRRPMGGGQQPMQGGKQSMQGSQRPMGGSQQSMQGGQAMGGQRARSFEDHLTDELWILLEDFSEVTHVAEWCATECAYAGPQLATCARVCEDIAEVAELNEKLIARDSPFGPEVAHTFVRVATEGLPELRRFQDQHPHVAETIATIERTINSCTAMFESGEPGRGGQRMGGQQQMGGQQMGSQQTGGQQMGGTGERQQGPGGY